VLASFQLIHTQVRGAIEAAVHEELAAALGAAPYERNGGRRGYRNGVKARTLTGPTGPLALTLPRGTLFAAAGEQEWTSRLLPRYQRRVREVNEAVVGTYLAGGNQRRIRGALPPLLKAAPLSKSAVSRVVATLKDGLTAWMARSLAELDVVYLYLDALALRVRSAGKVVSVPVLALCSRAPSISNSALQNSKVFAGLVCPGISRAAVPYRRD
jgi:transposase-like protein